jgi:hypothetical protein
VSALMFIVRRSVANAIKGLTKKPALLVLYIFVALMFVGMLVMVFVMPQGLVRSNDPALFRVIASALAIVVYYFSLRQGIEKGGSMFRAADVHHVFTGPFRPNDALLYGFVKQMGTIGLVLFVAVFQVPNLKNNFELQPYGVWVIILAVALIGLTYPIFGMGVYAFASKSRARKKLASGLLNAAVAVLLVFFVYNLYNKGDLMAGALATFDSPFFTYFPVIGWLKGIISAAVDGINAQFWAGLGLMTASVAASVALLYRLNLDYYEEVLGATEYREAAIIAKREGNNLNFGVKARRKVTSGLSGAGARALFGKNMLELRKSAFVLFFDRSSLIIIASALAFKFIMPNEQEINDIAMMMVLSFSVYMLFILQMQGRWAAELGRHYIFTLPARASEKLFWVTAGDHIKNLIDGAALFVIAGIVLTATGIYPQFPLATCLVCIVSYVFLGAVFVYGDVMARRLFGSVHSKPLQVFLKLFLVLFVVAPGVAASVVAGIFLKAEIFSAAAFGLWGLVAAAAVFAISSGIFKNIEAGA